MTSHLLKASPETCHWGYFDAAQKPALRVSPGDTVRFETVSGRPEALAGLPAAFSAPPELAAIHQVLEPTLGPHILTGPVAVEGAQPGDTLEIRVNAVSPRQNWGYTQFRPGAGSLPEAFDHRCFEYIGIDEEASVARPPWGGAIRLAPFPGVVGVAPPVSAGRITSIKPGEHGGNLDNKHITAGARLFLPVHVPGGLISIGDGHGVQGDGEVCITALETALSVDVTIELHRGWKIDAPFLETPTHLVTMGLHEDLDECLKLALSRMIDQIVERTNLSRDHAYMLCSLSADFHVTQNVNQIKGVHGMLERRILSSIEGSESL